MDASRGTREDWTVALRGLPSDASDEHANALDVEVLYLALRARPRRLVPVVAGVLQDEEVPAVGCFIRGQPTGQGLAGHKDIVDVRAPHHARPVARNAHAEFVILGWVEAGGQSGWAEAYPH